ncbi:MAG: SulP family inorganic anion transporter [Deltaproteobacteria bacterium]|nr:SulP family inorganic anion transporter [Deltaproteobacteria bacterium]
MDRMMGLRSKPGMTQLLPGMASGLVVGIVTIIMTISYATLVFTGPLAQFLGIGLSVSFFSAVLLAGLMALFSSFPGNISSHSAPPSIVLSLLMASLAAQLHAASTEVLLHQMLSMLAVSSLAVGLFFYALGAFKLGTIFRFIPYPVIGGVTAGVGWLLTLGGFSVATDLPMKLNSLAQALQPEVLPKWLVGLACAGVLIALQYRIKHYLLVPSLFGIFILAFHALTFVLEIPLSTLQAHGWLFGAVSSETLWHTPDLTLLTQVDWSLMAQHAPNIGALMLVSMIMMLTNSSALELLARKDIDLDHDLRANGWINIAIGVLGGISGMVNIAQSALAHQTGSSSRLTGVVCAATLLAFMMVGGAMILFLPRPVIAGMLMFNGLSLLREWVYRAWFKLPSSDYFIVLIILLTAAIFGYVQSLGVGILAGIILFVVNYSRINAVKHVISGRHIHSNVDRPETAREYLTLHGHQILVLKLQGYLFFGTSNRILAQVRQRMENTAEAPLRCVVLDFRQVNGLDSSSVFSFIKMQQIAETTGLRIAFTHLTDALAQLLLKGGVGGKAQPQVLMFDDLHRGLQWCEEYLLSSANLDESHDRPVPILSILKDILPAKNQASQFLQYLERLEVPPEGPLISQGMPSHDLYFIESGRFRVELELRDGHRTLVRTLGAGSTVGEVAFYLDVPRSAWVVADKPATVYRLTNERLADMANAHPPLATSLHEYMARMLAGRLMDTNRLLQEVID